MQGRAKRLKRIRHLKRVALALAVAGIAAPAAQANYPDAGYRTGDDSATVIVRGESKAGIRDAGLVPASTVVRGENKTDVRDVGTIPVAVSPPEAVGFDWRDAGIGAAGAFALALLGASAMLGLRRGRDKSGLATA